MKPEALAAAKALAKEVCAVDGDILFCAIVGGDAELVASATKDGTSPRVPAGEVELFLKRWDLVRKIDDTGDSRLGPTRSAAVFRDGLTLVSVNLPDGACALVGARPTFDPSKIRLLEKTARSFKL